MAQKKCEGREALIMRIAIDLLPVQSDGSAGGAAGFAIELIREFSLQKELNIYVLCGDWNIEYLKKSVPHNVKFLLPFGERRYFGITRIDRFINRVISFFSSTAILKKNSIDLLFCPFSAPTCRENGVPTVSTILDIQHEFYPQFFSSEELSNRRNFYKKIVKGVEYIVGISDFSRTSFCEKYGYPTERSSTIYIAIQERFCNEDRAILDKLNIANENYIVYPANFWEHKNHKLLLTAFGMYMSKESDSSRKLVLTGNALEQIDYYLKLIERLNLKNSVIITGYISDDELYSILKNARGLIYPSLFEGFGIPIVEAMQLHKLVACSSATSLPEIGCQSIHYFDPRKPDEICEAISYLFENDISKTIIDDYSLKLKDYSTERMAKEYIRVFERVIKDTTVHIFEEGHCGIFEDGWATKEIIVRLDMKEVGALHIEMLLPEFVKAAERFWVRKEGFKRKYLLKAGESMTLDLVVPKGRNEITLLFSNVWKPDDLLNNSDIRELSVMISKMILTRQDSTVNMI